MAKIIPSDDIYLEYLTMSELVIHVLIYHDVITECRSTPNLLLIVLPPLQLCKYYFETFLAILNQFWAVLMEISTLFS